MVSSSAIAGPRYYTVVETDEDWNHETNNFLRRWVIVDDRGNTASMPATFRSTSRQCAALIWWVAQTSKTQPVTSRPE